MHKARAKRDEYLDKKMLSNQDKLEKAKKLRKEMEKRQAVKNQLQAEKQKIRQIRTEPIRKAAKGVRGFMQQSRAKAAKNQSNMFGSSGNAFALGSGGNSPFDITPAAGQKAPKKKSKGRRLQIGIKV